MTSRIPGFLAELKRRKVYHVAVVYMVVGFAVIEGGQLIFDALEFPRAAWQFVVVLTILGFPLALVLAWALEMTPEGLRVTPSAEPAEGAAANEAEPTAGDDQPTGAPAAAPDKPVTVRRPADDRPCVVVLPFAKLSGDHGVEPLAREILPSLAEAVPLWHAWPSRRHCAKLHAQTLSKDRPGAQRSLDRALLDGLRRRPSDLTPSAPGIGST